MRRSTLVHRFLPEQSSGDNGFADLVDSGYLVALGPGLVAGTPLFEGLLEQVENHLLETLAEHGVCLACLPACEGEALVNLMAHMGWAGAESGLAASGTGFRELAPDAEGLHGLALYRRVDVVRLERSDAPPAADLARELVLALEQVGVQGMGWTDDGLLQAAGKELGRMSRRELAPQTTQTPASDAEAAEAEAPIMHSLLLLELDLYAVAGVLAQQHRDERGLSWPVACAPFVVALVEAAGDDPVAREMSAKLESELQRAGIATLRDDTQQPAAEQRRAAERLGIPLRVLCGPTCAQGVVVLESRRGGTPERVTVGELLARVSKQAATRLASGTGQSLGGPRNSSQRARRLRALY